MPDRARLPRGTHQPLPLIFCDFVSAPFAAQIKGKF
jgi:hypothetical protein